MRGVATLFHFPPPRIFLFFLFVVIFFCIVSKFDFYCPCFGLVFGAREKQLNEHFVSFI